MSDLKLDVDQAGELKAAFRREGPWTNEEIKKLCERRGFLSDVRQVLLGFSEIKPMEHVVDCDTKLFLPNGWWMEEVDQLLGRVRGPLAWNPNAVKLYRSKSQREGKYIAGEELAKELAKKPVLPAQVLDFLLANKHLIPESWKEKTNGHTTYIFFWGTIYRGARGFRFVRCLCWDSGAWFWSCGWLASGWHAESPAVLAAS